MEKGVRAHFEEILFDPLKNIKGSRCLIVDCKSIIKDTRYSALKRHLEQVHESKFQKIREEVFATLDDDNNFPLQRAKLIQDLIEFVTVNGRPINAIYDSGFQNLLNRQVRQLAKVGCDVSVTRGSIMNRIQMLAGRVREEIFYELKGKSICLLVDIATRHNRSVLGVNAQYVSDGNVILRTLGVITLNCRHTAQNLAAYMIDLLKNYGVSLDQVIAFVSDNGANMLATRKYLNKVLSDDKDGEEEASDNEEEENDGQERVHGDPTMAILLSGNYYSDLLKAIGSEFAHEGVEVIHGVRCAAHTIQLAVNGSVDNSLASNQKQLLQKVQDIVKKLRTQNGLIEIKNRNLIVPLLNNDTRWSTKYLMVRLSFYMFIMIIIMSYVRHCFFYSFKMNFSKR